MSPKPQSKPHERVAFVLAGPDGNGRELGGDDLGQVFHAEPLAGVVAGEQQRDFVFVDDVVAVNLWLLEQAQISGIFNVGSGRAHPFNDVAQAVVNAGRAGAASPTLTLDAQVEQELVRYVDFPAALVGKYQCHTQADLGRLRRAGCSHTFADVALGVSQYIDWLAAQD